MMKRHGAAPFTIVTFAWLAMLILGCSSKKKDEWSCPLMGLGGGATGVGDVNALCSWSWECRERHVAVNCSHSALAPGPEIRVRAGQELSPGADYRCVCQEWEEGQLLEYEAEIVLPDPCTPETGETTDSRLRAYVAKAANEACGWNLPTSY